MLTANMAPKAAPIPLYSVVSQIPGGPSRVEYKGKSYHRALLELALAAIILGTIFLLFWQGVLSIGGQATWDANHCRRLLASYEPAVMTDMLAEERTDGTFRLAGVFSNGTKIVEMRGTGKTVETCMITIVSTQPTGGSFGDTYNCTIALMRYRLENQTDKSTAGVQTELLPDVLGIDSTLARFTTIIAYYNPDSDEARADFAALTDKLHAHECAV